MVGRYPRRGTLSLAVVVVGVLGAVVNGAFAAADEPSGPGTGGALGTAGAVVHTIFGDRVPQDPPDPERGAVEIGTVFRTSRAGLVAGARFFKSAGNTGTHTANLWTSDGSRLATATFDNESPSGWQTVAFSQPVTIDPDTDYVVSYHAATGGYAADLGFLDGPITNGPLVATGSRHGFGAGTFPTDSTRNSRYWVDVAFVESLTPAATATTPAPPAAPTGELLNAAPAPPSGDFPNASNTGVPPGTTLRRSGDLTVSQPGQVVEGLDMFGTINVTAPNVTIRNSRFTGDGHTLGVRVITGGSVTVTDSEFVGNFATAAIGYDNWTMLRCDISGLPADGVKIGNNVLFQDNYAHSFRPDPEAHADGAQVESAVVNATVRHNTIIQADNAAAFVSPNFGPTSPGPLVIDNNLVDNGNYTVFLLNGNHGQFFINNITFTNNRFGRGSQYGSVHVNTPISQSGNVWSDTGEPINLG